MKQLAGVIIAVFAIGAFLSLSQVEVLAWGINYPGGRVQWGNDRGVVRFPGGKVKWGEYGAVQFPGGSVGWDDRGRGGVGIDVPRFNFNVGW
jgi:hypothetical protein